MTKTLDSIVVAKSGEKCPEGGIWHPAGNQQEARAIGRGHVMRPTPNQEPHWVLLLATGQE